MDNLTKKCEFKQINDNIKYLQEQAIFGNGDYKIVKREINKCDVCEGIDSSKSCYYVLRGKQQDK
jgi:hypothetical protein